MYCHQKTLEKSFSSLKEKLDRLPTGHCKNGPQMSGDPGGTGEGGPQWFLRLTLQHIPRNVLEEGRLHLQQTGSQAPPEQRGRGIGMGKQEHRTHGTVMLSAPRDTHSTWASSTPAVHHYRELWGPGKSYLWQHATLSPALCNSLWMFSNQLPLKKKHIF